jgi:hypothetical protein
MTIKETREELKKDCYNKFSEIEKEEIVENIADKLTDFTVGNHRFIHIYELESVIYHEVSVEELCYYEPDVISEGTGLTTEIVALIQKNDAYELLNYYVAKNKSKIIENMLYHDENYDILLSTVDSKHFTFLDYIYFRVEIL